LDCRLCFFDKEFVVAELATLMDIANDDSINMYFLKRHAFFAYQFF